MRFGDRIRELRKAKGLDQRTLADQLGVSFTYVSKIENHHLDFGEYPSEALIHRLAGALDADEDELLISAEKVPQYIRKRVLERPDAFRALALADDEMLDQLVHQLLRQPSRKQPVHRKPK